MTRYMFFTALAAAVMLAACEPPERPPEEDMRPDPVDGMTVEDEAEQAGVEPAPDDAFDHFNANFAGRWGMSRACEREGMFTLTAERWALYELVCAVNTLGREGDMSFARVSCTAEGQSEPDRTLTIRATGPDEITVEDGHYDWIRYRCQ
ncbi:hypothetical protein X907_2248 [Glycocaulis alkaliphilus]|uniref:Uncharacterized protein n=1 Tax=Glycocaulis alkaliphilus TaxID=1434191 RepID=A0A3T0EBE9_9PROT|nr:hypothetical protein [Glycocaulis alkaliphilus]AZU04763.1 hypothetical protein X907_2248 [Glycocaulis alkaliphilus]GGB67825.1 hypothetical protein GCM10007417_04590 [Glycocaulis alkaliphilus]